MEPGLAPEFQENQGGVVAGGQGPGWPQLGSRLQGEPGGISSQIRTRLSNP